MSSTPPSTAGATAPEGSPTCSGLTACETHGPCMSQCAGLVMAEQNPTMWTPQLPLCVDTCGACQVSCRQTLSLPLGEHSGAGPLGFTGSAGLPLTKPQTRFCVHSACTTGTHGGSVKKARLASPRDLPPLIPQCTPSPGPVCSQLQTATQHTPSGLCSLGKEKASVKCINA